MKQILQSLKDGRTELAEVPAPRAGTGQILIRTTTSLVSAGTERMLLEFGKANWLDKARQQPDKVRMVLDKLRTDGLQATLDTVRSKLDQPVTPGYCNVGTVVEVGSGVAGYAAGDRIASNGHHAEFVAVPVNLCARVPDAVDDERAAFTVVGAIGLEGVRLAEPTLGECVAVIGLGLIGLLTVQLLRAHGCRVLGLDFNPARLALAKKAGADVVDLARRGDPAAAATAFSRGRGMDAVLITASTRSNDPVHQAALMCRKRGRIVLVGVTGLALSRDDFYKKELSFRVSCSYGPGRYDPAYEEQGRDYPVGFVRWTEQRNFEAVLDLMAAGALDPAPLVTHRFPFARALDAYAVLGGTEPSLGILLEYGDRTRAPAESVPARSVRIAAPTQPLSGAPGVAFIGAGNYAGRILMPAFKAAGADLRRVVSAAGVSAAHYGRKFGFAEASTDTAAAIRASDVRAVVVATRHASHARYVLQALAAGKHVFCEKPLCLTLEDLATIQSTASADGAPRLMVGFNRRFAPQVVKMKALLAGATAPRAMVMTVNAGAIPTEHWTQDPSIGGGRIVGEACHFIDLLRFLAGAPIIRYAIASLGAPAGLPHDSATITLEFADGSRGTVHYLANGNKAFPKERLEVFCAGRVLQLDNFRRLRGWGWKGFRKLNLWRQDKGQQACAKLFVDALRSGGPAPIPLDEVLEVSRVAIELQHAA